MRIKTLTASQEREKALQLAWEVFLLYEAPIYPPSGCENFRCFLQSEEAKKELLMYGAYENDTLCGMLSVRFPNHICLFFVNANKQKKGIGRLLFETYCREYPNRVISVNSSPYAIDIYKRLGFYPTDTQQLQDGILYTPMIRKDKLL